MFKFFQSFLNRRRLIKALESYLSPEDARRIADSPAPSSMPSFSVREIEVVCVAISAPDAATYSERAGIVADLACEHLGTVHPIVPVMLIAFGDICTTPADSRLPFIASVQTRLPDSSAIVHGRVTASVGQFGSAGRFNFGAWWPGALDALLQVAALSPGQVRELPASGEKDAPPVR